MRREIGYLEEEFYVTNVDLLRRDYEQKDLERAYHDALEGEQKDRLLEELARSGAKIESLRSTRDMLKEQIFERRNALNHINSEIALLSSSVADNE